MAKSESKDIKQQTSTQQIQAISDSFNTASYAVTGLGDSQNVTVTFPGDSGSGDATRKSLLPAGLDLKNIGWTLGAVALALVGLKYFARKG